MNKTKNRIHNMSSGKFTYNLKEKYARTKTYQKACAQGENACAHNSTEIFNPT